ncbi:hypothetical protein ACLOAV_010645 [Pseudogymnoascus australis]
MRSFLQKFGSTRKRNAQAETSLSRPTNNPDDPGNFKDSFVLPICTNTDLWPELDPTLHASQDCGGKEMGGIHMDYTMGIYSTWANGGVVGRNDFGSPKIPFTDKPALLGESLPSMLFDLSQNRVVRGSELKDVHYAAISHVWGDLSPNDGIDGQAYGVDWKIPISSRQKLEQIFEASRIALGVKYIWIDVLCLNQTTRNPNEIAKMNQYFANAIGCLVWLEPPVCDVQDINEEEKWAALGALRDVNSTWGLDAQYIPTGGPEMLLRGQETRREQSASEMIEVLRYIGQFPWFNRVWTLQEGVVPDNLLFCTPLQLFPTSTTNRTRYVTTGLPVFGHARSLADLAIQLTEQGDILGTEITQYLQSSPVWKMFRLRQLHRQNRLSYWHVAQALKTRTAKLDHDRIFGICGLFPGLISNFSDNRSPEDLQQELYKSVLEAGDFSACCFLGGKSQATPCPMISLGIPGESHDEPNTEKHAFELIVGQHRAGIYMKDIGVSQVSLAYPLSAGTDPLKKWLSDFPDALTTNPTFHTQIATAFGLDTSVVATTSRAQLPLCPAFFAAMYGSFHSLLRVRSAISDPPGLDFDAEFHAQVPLALRSWIKYGMLDKAVDGNAALAVLWINEGETEGDLGEPMLAVVTEPPPFGNCVIITPGSYVQIPGPSCLVCKREEDGSYKKIGVGIGTKVRAKYTTSTLIV